MRIFSSVVSLIIFFGSPVVGNEKNSSVRPFFAFENGMRGMAPAERIELLRELGYGGVGSASPGQISDRLSLYDEAELEMYSLYLGLDVFLDRFEIQPGVSEAIALLKGRGETTYVELYVRGERDHPRVREQAILGVREVARLSEEAGLRVVLYPHAGFHIDTVRKAYELARSADRPNVGVMFNLCHFLKVEPKSNLREVLTGVKPLLWRVSTSGADIGGTDWGALIQPLDSGTFSQKEFFQILDEVGFRGVVGLQCFGIKAPSRDHLRRSVAAWQELSDGSTETVLREDFSGSFDATAFLTPIPNRFTKLRDGVLWTSGLDPEAKYPPMVYYGLDGPTDVEIEFRYRILGNGGWLCFFVDADDGGGGMDHCFRVRLHPDKVVLQVDGKTYDENHPDRQPTRPPDKVSGLYRVPERLDPVPLDLGTKQWRTVRLSFEGENLTLSLPEMEWSQTLSRPNFPHPKRKLLWMQNGGEEGIEIDDLTVTTFPR